MVTEKLKKVKAAMKAFPSINAFLQLHMVTGHYYKLSNSKRTNFIATVYCVVVVICTSVIQMMLLEDWTLTFISSLFEYVLNSTRSLGNRKSYLPKFIYKMKLIDQEMTFEKKPLVTKTMKAIIFTSISFRVLVAILYTIFVKIDIYVITTNVIVYSNELSILIIVMIFNILYDRMKSLQRLLTKEIEANNNELDTHQVLNKSAKVHKYVQIYYKMLNNLDEFNVRIQISMIIALGCSFPKSLKYVYHTIECFINGSDSFTDVMFIVFQAVATIILPLVAAIFVELAANELEKIKASFTLKLSKCNDQLLCNELQHALNSMSWRPVQFRLCRCVPVDATLPLSYLGLVFTYTVVVMQFVPINRHH